MVARSCSSIPPDRESEVRFRVRAVAATRLTEASIPVPSEVFVDPDGAAIASYGGERLVRFERFERFLLVHALGIEDLEAIEPVVGVPRRLV